MITIYDFPQGLRGLRAAWLCEEMNLPHCGVPVAYPPEPGYLALNGSGRVPYLVDGEVDLSESVAIMLYIAQRYGPTKFLPACDDEGFAKVLQFTISGEAELSALMTPLLTARFGAPEDHKRNWSVVGLEGRLQKTIARLAKELGDRPFMVGSHLTIADISISTALQLWQRGLNQDLPATLIEYSRSLQDRPAYQRAIQSRSVSA